MDDMELLRAGMWHELNKNEPGYRAKVERPGQIWPGDMVRIRSTGETGTWTGETDDTPHVRRLTIQLDGETRSVPLLALEKVQN